MGVFFYKKARRKKEKPETKIVRKEMLMDTKKNVKKNKVFRKLMASVLSLAIIFTGVPLSSITAEATNAVTGTFGWGGTLCVNGNGAAYTYPSNQTGYLNMYIADYNSEKVTTTKATQNIYPIESAELKAYRVNGKVAYCVEHGLQVNENTKLKGNKIESSMLETIYENSDREYILENLSVVLLFGRQDTSGISDLTKSADEGGLGFLDWVKQKEASGMKMYGNGKYTASDWEAATRQLVHETQQQHRDENFNLKANGLKFGKSLYGPDAGAIPANHYQTPLSGKPAYDIYRFMEEKVKNYTKFPAALGNPLEANPLAIQVTDEDGDNVYESKLFPIADGYAVPAKVLDKDGTQVADNVKIYVTDADGNPVDTIIDGEDYFYKYEVTGTPNPDMVYRVMKNDSYVANYCLDNLLIWETGSSTKHLQAMATGAADPLKRFVKFTEDEVKPPQEVGPCEQKQADIPDYEYYPMFEFPVGKDDLNPGFDGDVNTPMGDATLGATYTLYRNGVEVDSVTLDAYGSTATLSDIPWTEEDDLKRTESGSTKPHWQKDGEDVTEGTEGATQHCCDTVEPAKVEWEAEVEYKIVETRPDGRFIEPDSGIRTYTVTLYAETHDQRDYACEASDFTDIEAEVKIIPGSGNSGSTVTEGPAPTDEMPTTITADEETFINDNFRGQITIIKSNENDEVFDPDNSGGTSQSRNSKWKVRLISGGYENHPYIRYVFEGYDTSGTAIYRVTRDNSGESCNDVPLDIGRDGSLVLLDAPYGEYMVEEVAADNSSYVLESFRVVVGEYEYGRPTAEDSSDLAYDADGKYDNHYSYNVRDRKIRNVVKIVKTNTETDKRVPFEGTRFYIQYMGGVVGTDIPTDESNVGRYLPNGPSIDSDASKVFVADEFGELTIPYELEAGTYRISEFMLPEGYFVGDCSGNDEGMGENADYGSAGEMDALDGILNEESPDWDQLVTTYDKDGNKVEYNGSETHKLGDVVNFYTFTVTRQDVHVDGNFGDIDKYPYGNPEPADPDYDPEDYPYIHHYQCVEMDNNVTKGQIEITKLGEILIGFKETIKDGLKIFEPVWEMLGNLKDAVFGIFAADDVLLPDGNSGPEIYDKETDELITIPTTKSTNTGNAEEEVSSSLSHFFTGRGAVYDTGELEHSSGAKLWYLLNRDSDVNDGETNNYRRVYVSPENKGTTYQYSYETMSDDGKFKIRYDVYAELSYQAGGVNVTDLKVTKVTTAANGYVLEIPETVPAGSVGDEVLDPLETFISGDDTSIIGGGKGSILTVADSTYTYEANGSENGTDMNGDPVDLSDIGAERFVEKQYDRYRLTDEDLVKEERTLKVTKTPGVDANGDGDYDDVGEGDVAPTYEDVKITKEKYLWDNLYDGLTVDSTITEYELVNPVRLTEVLVKHTYTEDNEEGQPEEVTEYMIDTVGYYSGGEYTNVRQKVHSDENGTPKVYYEIPEGWTQVPFTGSPGTDSIYVIIKHTETVPVDPENPDGETQEVTTYKVLLDDEKTWQECDENGNFKKMLVQAYEIHFTQEPTDTEATGFTAKWDGFEISASADKETKTATTVITRPDGTIVPEIHSGAGYNYTDEGGVTTITSTEPDSPIYFLTKDNVRTEMYYAGGFMKATITVPESAVDSSYEYVVPTLAFMEKSSNEDGEEAVHENIIDWYSGLTPDNRTKSGSPVNGVEWTTTWNLDDNGDVYYEIVITSNQTEDAPMKFTYKDGYTMTMYAGTAESGNGVGVIEVESIYNTNRSETSKLVDTITTDENGIATSRPLDLGKYIVRELDAPNGYVTNGEGIEVELTYEDQFVPIVWSLLTLTNKRVEVELDLEKVFETYYESGQFTPGSGATFGVYTAEDITANGTAGEGIIKMVPKDTLVGSVTFDENGKALETVKLPNGTYYLKEIATKDGYVLNETPFYFVVNETDDDKSAPCEFNYKEEGISGNVVLDSYGKATINVRTETRYPMPTITVNGKVFDLSQAAAEGNVTVTKDRDAALTEVKLSNGETASITLPNGKELSVTLTGNTYTYTLDGTTTNYVTDVSYTGYYEKYDSTFTPEEGENLNVKTDEITVTEAGSSNAVNVTIIHDPVYTTETTLGDIGLDLNGDGDYDDEGEQPPKPSEEIHKGVLDEKGFQTYTHTGKFSMAAIAGDVTRSRDGVKETVTADADGNYEMLPGDTFIFATNTGATVELGFDKDGTVTVIIYNTLDGKAIDPTVTVNGEDKTDDLFYAKNVTAARQDHEADTIQIKFNTADDVNAGPIENEKAPGETPPPVIPPDKPTPDEDNPEIKTKAWDKATKDHISSTVGETTIVDTVYYWDLTPGKEYTLKGTLMNPETKEPITVDDKEITAETTFVPEKADGEVDVEFTVNTETLKGVTGVFFEELYLDGKLVDEHKDYDDDEQTVNFPEIGTKASHTATGLITDIVEYHNLIPGKEYTIKGVLMDKKTNLPVLSDGKEITGSVTFTPDKPDGEVEMKFYFKESDLAGKTTVVFEKLYYNGVLIADHEDINDENQTVLIITPGGRTVEISPKTGDSTGIMVYMLTALMGLATIAGAAVYRRRR